MDIHQALASRTDLATFVVHLTRDTADGNTARQNLEGIVNKRAIEARNPMGVAASYLTGKQTALDSQKVVCFTESPLDMIKVMAQHIDKRDNQFKPYGIAIPRRLARDQQVNPVWYIDVSKPFHPPTDLYPPLKALIDAALKSSAFEHEPIARLTPFFETMGPTSTNEPKEFWWEREWRHSGNFTLPNHYLGLCPENEVQHFEQLAQTATGGSLCRFFDPAWSLDRIIGHIAGFTTAQLKHW